MWPPRSTGAAIVVVVLLCLFLSAPARAASVRSIFIEDDIPDLLFVGSHFIFENSDTAWLNSRMLRPDIDYRFDNTLGAFDLRTLPRTSTDTLLIVYHPLPRWVPRLTRPPAVDDDPDHTPPPDRLPAGTRPPGPPAATDISISGAKSFRFTSASRGNSQFNQTLDMSIFGDLAPGVTISGSISDRGYDPVYGTANSRLDELDKVNLSLTSPHVSAQIGDLTTTPFQTARFARTRRISGVTAAYHDEHLTISALAARPKGRFTTVRFQGADNVQGPYTITREGPPAPIVPGSETVWLDGRKLERGGNNDYTMDYPAGRITFTADHPIDSRSRIEIDFEPQATAYRAELYSAAASTAWRDSAITLSVTFTRDGDDSRQPLVGSLSDTDLDLLRQIGDSTERAVRSGITPDTNGAWVLETDSLPDSVFTYVGAGGGNYSVQFSFVGAGNGAYRFLGGQEFRYVGVGRGDYAPVITLQAPERLDLTTMHLTLAPEHLGILAASVEYSSRDRNLLSDLDDTDNSASLLEITYNYNWMWKTQSSIALRTRILEPGFANQSRLDSADFSRRFLAPIGDSDLLNTTQRLHEGRIALAPAASVELTPAYARLEYDNHYVADRIETRLAVKPTDHTAFTTLACLVRSDRDSANTNSSGRVDGITSGAAADFARWGSLNLRHEYDRREHDYHGTTRGTRLNAVTSAWQLSPLTLSAEYYTEDTLTARSTDHPDLEPSPDWRNNLDRLRLTTRANGALRKLTYDLRLTWQQVTRHSFTDRTGYEESSLLARLGSAFRDPARRLSLDTDYIISEETRNARGLAFLEVEPGTGDYILEEGRYIPDPEGNFIRVEELLSDTERVRRGEKSFHFSRQWQPFTLRFDSRIEEELLADGHRAWWWVVPFLSDPDQPYLYYLRRYDTELRAIPIGGIHLATVKWQDTRSVRRIGGVDRASHTRTLGLLLKQRARQWFLEQEAERFDTRRDDYYNSGADITGYQLSARARRLNALGELSGGLRYRHAESGSIDRIDLYGLTLGSRLRVISRGELRASVEFYTQQIRGTVRGQAYQFTQNLTGDHGATWDATANYHVKGGVRANLTLRGRHSNDRPARVTVRGEVVASF